MESFLKWFTTVISVGMIMGCVFVMLDADNAYVDAWAIHVMGWVVIAICVIVNRQVWKNS